MPANTSARYQYEGSELTETLIVRTGGATVPTDDEQPESRLIVTTAGAQWLRPFKGEPLAIWNPTAGAAVTVSVYGAAVGSATVVNSDEIWLEVEYLNSGSAQGAIVTTTKADLLATGSPVASDSSVWLAADGTTTFPVLDGYISSGVALSNGNKTATHTGTANNQGVRSATFVSTGKFYFEILCNAGGITPDVGIISNSASGIGAGGEGFYTGVGVTNSFISNNLGTVGINLGSAPTGTIFCFAINLTDNLGWIRKNGGPWNANGAANPATGVAGIAIRSGGLAGRTFAPYVHFSTANGEVFTLNCGQSSFAYVPPSGFFGWGGVTPFRLTTTVTPGQAGYLYGRVRAAKPGTSYYIDPQIELSAAAGGTVNIATAYKSSRYTYEGTETTETSIVRTGGTADPTAQVQSRKIVTTANALWVRPFKAEPYAAWNATTGANVTATIYGVVNGSLPLNDEIWAEFECVSEIVAVVGDSNWFNVKLLMGFEGADAATGGPGMTDEGSSARGAATVVGNAQIDTAQFKLGTSSLLLDGSGDYLTFPDSADWDFGAGQFTIEGFFRFAATPTNTILLAQWSGGWAFWFSGGVLGFRPASGGDTNGYTFSPTLNQWYHIAIDRDASNVARIYVDGVMQSKTTTYTANITGSSSVLAVGSLTPGGFNTYDLNGWIDEVRISAGVARYASDAGFAVPTAPFPRVAGVTGGTFVGKIVSTTKANLLAAGTAVAPDISVWSGAAIPAWAPFKLTATLTPGLAGYIHARVRVGKASATYYIDPQVYLT